MGRELNEDYLAYKMCQFLYNYDPYEFRDNYETIQDAHEEFKNNLYSYANTTDYLYNMKEIAKDLSGDDPQLVSLYQEALEVIKALEEHKKTFDKDIEL